MEPDLSDLKKRSSMVKEFATKFVDENDMDVAKKVCGLWVDLCAVVSNLVSSNNRMQSIATEGMNSMKALFDGDGVQKLVFIKNLRKKMVSLCDKLEELQPQIGEPTHESHPNPMDTLLSLPIPQAFLSELHRESIDDLLSFGVSQCFQTMDRLLLQFGSDINETRKKKDPDHMDKYVGPEEQLQYFLQWSSTGDAPWGANILDDATEADLSSTLQSTIHKIPAQQTQAFCKAVGEARLLKLILLFFKI